MQESDRQAIGEIIASRRLKIYLQHHYPEGTYVKVAEGANSALHSLGEGLEVTRVGTDHAESAELALQALKRALEVETTSAAAGEVKVQLAEVESGLLLVSHCVC
jgi:hypothetical protein